MVNLLNQMICLMLMWISKCRTSTVSDVASSSHLAVWRPTPPLHPDELLLPEQGLMGKKHGRLHRLHHQRDSHHHGNHVGSLPVGQLCQGCWPEKRQQKKWEAWREVLGQIWEKLQQRAANVCRDVFVPNFCPKIVFYFPCLKFVSHLFHASLMQNKTNAPTSWNSRGVGSAHTLKA